MHITLRQLVVALLLFPTLAIAACTTPTNNATSNGTTQSSTQASPAVTANRLKVMTTVLPVYLFTKAVVGDAADVDLLIKPGTEVHDYQSTPNDVKAIAQSDVVIKNGLGLEEFLDSTIKSAENTKLTVIDTSRGIQTLGEISPVVSVSDKGEAHSHDHDRDHSHSGDHDHNDKDKKGGKDKKVDAHTHADGNPHVWLDPMLAKRQVETIRDELSAIDPKNKEKYTANAAAYIEQLDKLNDEFEQRLKGYKDRTFITFHDAFPYLAKRYQLQQVAVVAIPEDQLSPGDVQRTIAAVKQYNAKALLSEPGVDNKLLDSLANDLNLKLGALDSLEAGQLDPQYYFTAMRANLATLEAAFQ